MYQTTVMYNQPWFEHHHVLWTSLDGIEKRTYSPPYQPQVSSYPRHPCTSMPHNKVERYNIAQQHNTHQQPQPQPQHYVQRMQQQQHMRITWEHPQQTVAADQQRWQAKRKRLAEEEDSRYPYCQTSFYGPSSQTQRGCNYAQHATTGKEKENLEDRGVGQRKEEVVEVGTIAATSKGRYPSSRREEGQQEGLGGEGQSHGVETCSPNGGKKKGKRNTNEWKEEKFRLPKFPIARTAAPAESNADASKGTLTSNGKKGNNKNNKTDPDPQQPYKERRGRKKKPRVEVQKEVERLMLGWGKTSEEEEDATTNVTSERGDVRMSIASLLN